MSIFKIVVLKLIHEIIKQFSLLLFTFLTQDR